MSFIDRIKNKTEAIVVAKVIVDKEMQKDTDYLDIIAKVDLAITDYKMLPNYVPKPDEDLATIIAKRNETREFIRKNNA